MLRRSISSYRGTRRVKESRPSKYGQSYAAVCLARGQFDAYAQFPSSEEPTAKELAPEEGIYFVRAHCAGRENIVCNSPTTPSSASY
jgi:hypothetical protein